ncbi:hypothetical protein [Bradyrhizobium sp. 930_D9_N1_4]|uniref:hypothetical protein n=1 Tax=Bradyrhizobium sp. 930_D9_N1_4 TaxID=3240374 RepID=UPI003F8C41EA
MADDRFPNDPYRPNLSDDEYLRMARRQDEKLQADPELAEGPASSGKVAMFAVAVALVLGAVFYGLNNSSTSNQAGNAPTTQTAQQAPATNPAAPPGMRDVTPRANTEPGMTTGAAPSKPAAPADTPAAKPDPAAPTEGAK